MTGLNLLARMSKIEENIKAPSSEYWIREEEIIICMHERNNKLWGSIKPIWETANRKFDI